MFWEQLYSSINIRTSPLFCLAQLKSTCLLQSNVLSLNLVYDMTIANQMVSFSSAKTNSNPDTPQDAKLEASLRLSDS